MKIRFVPVTGMISGAVLGAALALVATDAGALEDAAAIRSFSVQISLEKERYYRGGIDPAAPVKDLIVTVTLTNLFKDIATSLPTPDLRPTGGIEFQIHPVRTGAEEPEAGKKPRRKPIPRRPLPLPVDERVEFTGVTLAGGESKQFKVNVGPWYAIRRAGKYEMSCKFENERSSAISFEVLPLKVTNVRARALISHINDFERDGPDYPFMFYVVHGGDRFDEVVYLVRRGRGADESYEYHRLSEIAPGRVPDMIVSAAKPGLVGVLVPDKRSDDLSRLFVINFATSPIKRQGRQIAHAAGQPPTLEVDAAGGISAQ